MLDLPNEPMAPALRAASRYERRLARHRQSREAALGGRRI